jgi:hypothetical protein
VNAVTAAGSMQYRAARASPHMPLDRVRDCVAGKPAPMPFVVDRSLVHLDGAGRR